MTEVEDETGWYFAIYRSVIVREDDQFFLEAMEAVGDYEFDYLAEDVEDLGLMMGRGTLTCVWKGRDGYIWEGVTDCGPAAAS